MVAGYFLFQVVMFGVGAAGVETPFNIIQIAVGGGVGIPIALVLRRQLQTSKHF